MSDKRDWFYKHEPLTKEQEAANEALIERLLKKQEEEKEKPCPPTS